MVSKNLTPIELQEYATKLSFGCLHSKNLFEAFDIYEMIIDDYNHRKVKLIEEQCKKYINDNFVSVEDLALGDENKFYVSSKE